MKLKLEVALSGVAIAVLSTIASVNAAPVYEIQNIIYKPDGSPDIDGSLTGTRNGYGTGVASVDGILQMVGLSQGRKKLSDGDIEDGGILDEDNGIAPSEQIRYSILEPILANNFSFKAESNSSPAPWTPIFLKINGQTATTDNENAPAPDNSVDVSLFAIADDGVKVGSMSAKQETKPYVGDSTTQKLWYYRAYEERGVAVNAAGAEVPLLPPYTQYVKDGKTAELGGLSIGAAVNNSGLVAGFASTGINKATSDNLDLCLTSTSTTMPKEVCIQQYQFPDLNGQSGIQYQLRAAVWQLNAERSAVAGDALILPLGLETTDTNTIFTAQGLGINSEGTVVGRSHTYRYGDTKNLRNDAAYWTLDTGKYVHHRVPVRDNDVFNSIATDINDKGILVGSFKSYIEGYVRDKFFYFDTTATDDSTTNTIVIPNDFRPFTSDLSSKPKSINNNGIVVGYIETTYEKELPRPKEAFYFDMNGNDGKGEFVNLNKQLTCESKGYSQTDGKWARHPIVVKDGNGKELSYSADFKLVDAVSINDDGVIVGTVFVRKPKYKLDAKGDPVLGTNGPLFELNGYGEPVTSYLPRSVVLTPAAGGVACTEVDDNGTDVPYERKGGAMIWALALLPLLWLRRKFS
ncbi:DUF3466 family protein [Shewanella sp. SNU WT4]|uniref:DUF3466 family protein n=1 Tax=Shewanella sp. SNU WT4 TaxID=2590015 RepID=UPI001125D92B|nr:DUF3466 family protein [Shewanella sp. SNU WT4]QDF67236.1 DUF3466 family protein [Shewanella sp. SNU WT4]